MGDTDLAVEKNGKPDQRPSSPGSIAWWRVLLGLAITAATIWYVADQVDAADMWRALANARLLPVAAGAAVIILTGLAKAWRWQMVFYPPDRRPPLDGAFWAIMLNQFVNNVVIGRFGEIARIYYINRTHGAGKAQAFGAIVVEKSLDMLFTVLVIVLVVPWVVLPAAVSAPALSLAVTSLTLLVALYLFAFQSRLLIAVAERVGGWLPTALGRRVVGITSAGLEGLAGLRDPRTTLVQLSLSSVVTLLYILTPYILFQAFDLPFDFIDAVLVHLWTSIVISIPSTPGRIGVFEGAVIAILAQLEPTAGVTVLLSYAITFHLVVMVPPLLLGGIAAIRSDWSWRRSAAA